MLIVNAIAMQTRKVGDYIYRVEQPSICLGKSGRAVVITVSTISPWFNTLCLSADILILHLLSEHDLLPIIEERKRRSRPTVYELSDNITALHEGVGIREWFSDPVNLALAFQYMRMADAVQVTSPGLAERFGFINPRIVILENQMASLGRIDRQASDRVVLGWAGSSGHRRDIAAVGDIIAMVMQECTHVDFAFMGDETSYHHLSDSLPVDRVTYSPPGTLDDYLTFLQTLDIGIAPLEDNQYNRCRSDVKFLEYASRGVAPVLSSLTPYRDSVKHGETGFLYDSSEELLSILSLLARDHTLRVDVGKAAYEYVKQSRLEDVHAEDRLAFYSSLLNNGDVLSVPPPELPVVRCAEGADYFELAASKIETLILSGIYHELTGSYDDAIKAYRLALHEDADCPLPWFWLGYCSLRKGKPEAPKYFDEATKRNPDLLRAHWLKAKALRDIDPMTAFRELATIFSHWPLYTPAAVSMAEILETHGVYNEAIRWYSEALRANPFCSPAAMGLGRIYELQNKMERAGAEFATAANLAPSWAEAQYRMAKWCLCSNDLERAAEYCERTLLADVSHSGVRDMIDEIEKRVSIS
ncbi:MAG TPA: tetratricopeptide repeat protein [Syntrophales bacterium]|nr:tetratricopeptide repeat protein [Syntrophales bacterium]